MLRPSSVFFDILHMSSRYLDIFCMWRILKQKMQFLKDSFGHVRSKSLLYLGKYFDECVCGLVKAGN